MDRNYDYGYETGSQRSIWYYLVFPLDAWARQPDPSFLEQKRKELWPVLILLMPLVVLLAGFFLDLGFFSSLLFYGLEALCFALVGKFYLKLQDFGQALELFFNFWLALLFMTLGLVMIVFLVSIFF
ncbi:MAG: hypothetical protein ACAI44_02755 [Candidatus Sericytochromatia bacterium]